METARLASSNPLNLIKAIYFSEKKLNFTICPILEKYFFRSSFVN
jgi:hypothetical protein